MNCMNCGKSGLLVVFGDATLALAIIALAIASAVAWGFAFPVSVYGFQVYFTLSSLAQSSQVTGCYIDALVAPATDVLMAVALSAAAISASTTASLVSTAVERKQPRPFERVGSGELELESGVAHNRSPLHGL